MRVGSHILRLLAGLLVLTQLSLPWAQAQAMDQGANLASLICNPSGRTASAEAKTALTDLLDALGDAPAETDPPHDCERCITPHAALSAPSSGLAQASLFGRPAPKTPLSEAALPTSPRGPPCGLRAPPIFI